MAGGVYSNETWRFDPVGESWSQVASLPNVIAFAAGESVNGKGYVVCGAVAPTSTAIQDDVWEYDPLNDNWTSRPAYPGLPTYTPVAFSLGGNLYVGLGNGGSSAGPYSDELWRFNPTSGAWTQMASLPSLERTRPSGTTWNGKGYVVGGLMQNGVSTDQVWEYDPVSNTWSAMMDYPLPIESPAIVTHMGQLVIAGGFTPLTSGMAYDAHYYNGISMGWSSIPSYPGQSLYTASTFTLNGTAYFGFGFITGSGTYTGDFWKLNGNANSVDELPAAEDRVQLFPNPVEAGEDVMMDLEGIWSYELYDIQGRMAAMGVVERKRISTDGLASGSYELQLWSHDNQRRVTRLIVD